MFEDTTTNPSIATRDWALTANQLSGPLEYFAVTDLEGGDENHVLLIEGGAPAEALRIAANGNVGLGTSLPAADLHIVNYLSPGIRFEQDATTYAPYIWAMNGRDTGFYISDVTGSNLPFAVLAGTPTYMMRIEPAGVGIGGGFWTAENTLPVRRDDGTAQVKVQEVSATTSPRTLLNL